MSKEILAAIKQEAVSRMSPYELVERAVGLRSEMYNGLGIDPVVLEDDRTLHTVTSGLAATGHMLQETVVEGDELIRRQYINAPLTAFADVVELQPRAGETGGNATLYRIEKPIIAIPAEARMLFRAAAVELIEKPDPVHKTMSPIRFNGITNTFYRTHPEIEQPDETYMSQGNVPLLASQRTHVQLETIGKNELDGQLGVLATLSGLARVTLKERHFARITKTGVLYGPSSSKTVEVNVLSTSPQHQDSAFHRIPSTAAIGPDENGELVVQGEFADDHDYKYTKLNPAIGPATILKLIPSDTIDWTDGTTAFIQTLSDRISRMLPLDMKDSYTQTLHVARQEIKHVLSGNLTPTVGNIGCLAVAARLAELPDSIDGTMRVNAAFFGATS